MDAILDKGKIMAGLWKYFDSADVGSGGTTIAADASGTAFSPDASDSVYLTYSAASDVAAAFAADGNGNAVYSNSDLTITLEGGADLVGRLDGSIFLMF